MDAQGEGGWAKEGSGVSGQQVQTVVYGVEKSESLLYQTGSYIQYPAIKS